MKQTKISILIMAFAVTVVTGCKKEDEVSKPQITIHELGDGDSHGNDHTAKIGGELHMDIEIIAEAKINTVQLIIHHEEDHKSINEDEWHVDTIYTKFYGLKNTEFHEHIEVDTTAEAGDYHFDFIVTDMDGNQSSVDSELKIIED